MKIDNIVLTEKSIRRENLGAQGQIQIKFSRMNYMPEKAEDKFSCTIVVDCVMTDSAGNGLCTAKVAYFIMATLENGETYEQNQTADALFRLLRLTYFVNFDSLICEVGFPKLPAQSFFANI